MAIKVLQNTEYAVSHSDGVKVRGGGTLSDMLVEEKTLTNDDFGWYDYVRVNLSAPNNGIYTFVSSEIRAMLKLPKHLASLKVTSLTSGYNYGLLSFKMSDADAPIMEARGEWLDSSPFAWQSQINVLVKPESGANYCVLAVKKTNNAKITLTEAFANLAFECTYYEDVNDRIDKVVKGVEENSEEFVLKDFQTRTLTFDNVNKSLTYNSNALGLEVGKVYKISASMETTNTSHISFYLRQVATTNKPNVPIKDKDNATHTLSILEGELSAEVYFTPDTSNNYQYLAAWHVNDGALSKSVTVVIQEVVSLRDYISDIKDNAETDVFISQAEMIQGLCINANANDTSLAAFGGTFAASTNSYYATGFINIKGAKRLVVKTAYVPVKSATSPNYGCGCVLYDSAKQPLTGYGFFVVGASGYGTQTFEIEVPDDAVYIRNTTWSETDAGITAYFDKGYALNAALEEKLNGEESKPDVVQRNAEAIEAIYAAKKRTKKWGVGATGPNHMKNFCIAHITDIHCDTKRYENFRKFIDSVDGINAAVNTGDLTIRSTANAQAATGFDSSQFDSIVNVEGSKEVMLCVGNHDKLQGNGQEANEGLTVIPNTSVYTLMKLNTTTGKLYYYKDFTETYTADGTTITPYKVRVIVLNQYDADGVLGSAINKYTTYSQAQIDWFIDTLQDAASNGYAVMVCMHTIERGQGIQVNNSKFYDRSGYWDTREGAGPETIIEDIIHVFRHGGTLNKSYTWPTISRTVSVNVTFSTTGTFIAYMTGHRHSDLIGYSKVAGHGDQLYLSGNCGCCYSRNYTNRPYGVEYSALPRQEGEKSEDCFNVYGINLEEKTVRVVRVGASINDHMERVDYDIYDFERNSSKSYGTSEQRPVTLKKRGAMYFDTTLNEPIWATEDGWVDEDGQSV